MRICGSFKSANHKNLGSANRKSPNICGRSANLTNYLIPQICWFAIYGTYLRPPTFAYFTRNSSTKTKPFLNRNPLRKCALWGARPPEVAIRRVEHGCDDCQPSRVRQLAGTACYCHTTHGNYS